MPITSLPFALVLTLAAVASAQDAAERQPPKWDREATLAYLGSTEKEEVAWAAWLARRDKMRAAIPKLRGALARLASDDELEGQLARLQILDALIEFKVDMPGEELLPHAVGLLRVPTLVLAARNPRLNTDYFHARFNACFDKHDRESMACGDVLAHQVAPHFAARCLQELSFSIGLHVTDGKRGGGRGFT
jgi:hypothetical protein